MSGRLRASTQKHLGAALGVLLACAHGGGGWVGPNGVRVEDVRARFTPEDRADVDIDFAVGNSGAASAVAGIEWEVWLGRRWFAAGTLSLSEPLPAGAQHRFTVTLPIVFRRAGSDSSEPTAVEIGVRGQILLGSNGRVEKVSFQDRRRIVVANAPSLGGSIDQR